MAEGARFELPIFSENRNRCYTASKSGISARLRRVAVGARCAHSAQLGGRRPGPWGV